MYRYQPPPRYGMRYSRAALPQRRRISRLTLQEQLWRRRWPRKVTILVALLMLLLTVIIFALEIASLAIDHSTALSDTASTGAGIWCSLAFFLPIVCMALLVFVFDCSMLWSVYTLLAHLICLIFTCILVGLDANAVTPYNRQASSAPQKIQMLRGQLAMAILMFLFPIAFVAIFVYTAFVARPPPRVYQTPIRPSLRPSIRMVKY